MWTPDHRHSNGVPSFPPTPGSALRGLKWNATINGRRCINGARYSATITGEIESSEDWSTIYDVMHDLAEHLKANNREMELPDSFQITLFPQNATAHAPAVYDSDPT